MPMSSELPIRVLSDLHIGHPASLVHDSAQIEPLLEGTRGVVFNGDTVEMRSKRAPSGARQHLERLTKLCLARGIDAHFINGNHDPEASSLDHFELMDGRLLVTHGHVLFPEITPWGREAKQLRRNHSLALEEISAGRAVEFEHRLRAVRQACLRTSGVGKIASNRLQWMTAAFTELAHPARPYQIFRAWINGPGLAAAFAGENRPRVQCILVGHTHLPGFWMRNGRLVINTGAYMPWFGRRLVDVSDNSLRIRAVVRDGKKFHAGRELFRWSLEPEVKVQEETVARLRSLGSE